MAKKKKAKTKKRKTTAKKRTTAVKSSKLMTNIKEGLPIAATVIGLGAVGLKVLPKIPVVNTISNPHLRNAAIAGIGIVSAGVIGKVFKKRKLANKIALGSAVYGLIKSGTSLINKTPQLAGIFGRRRRAIALPSTSMSPATLSVSSTRVNPYARV